VLSDRIFEKVAHLIRHQIRDHKVVGSSLTRVPLRSNLRHVIYTYVSLSPSNIIWYWPTAGEKTDIPRDALAMYPWSRSVSWYLTEGS